MTSFTVSLNDPSGLAGAQANAIATTMQAAANRWGALIQGFGVVDIQVNFARLGTGASSPLATGGSAETAFVENKPGLVVFQQSSAWEIQTGADINGTAADLIVTINSDLIPQLFFDASFSASIPPDKYDAGTIFLHEIGHGLAFNSLRQADGSLMLGTASDRSSIPFSLVYDNFVSFNNGVKFNGPNTNLVSGGVLLAGIDNTAHVSDINDLMNPSVSLRTRKSISDVDIAVAQDVGLPIATERAEFITLLSGNDVFLALGGDDAIVSGAGADSVVGGFGRDSIVLGEGNDVGLGNQGDDIIIGNQGDDIVVGGQDTDIVVGGQGNDFVFGNEGNDIVFGNEGNDTIFAGQGNDTLYGGQGSDTIWGNEGNDLIHGNEGADRFMFATNSGADVIIGFKSDEGDRLDFQGQSFSQTVNNGSLFIALSGGGTILIEGVGSLQSGLVA